MEFRQLKTFRVVAETLSFTKAAEKLFMAQSSVSAQIRSLEDELEVKLFDRIGRSVLITDAGRKLFDYAKRMEDMSDEIRSELTDAALSKGRLNIRIPETLATIYMPAIIEKFHTINPHVSLNFINCSDLQLREELNSGRLDLAFLMTDAINLGEVNVKTLKKENLILVAGNTHPFKNKKSISIKDLEDQTLVLAKTD
mgnify:FL=1